MKLLYKKGSKFNDWTLTSYKGGGGNGEVWACNNSKGETNAIKLLKNIKHKSYARFVDETTVIQQNSDIIGIIPIQETNLPKNINESTPYFIMPLAEPSEKKLLGKTIEAKIDALIQVAETLEELHKRKIYHRDIKPANILFYNSRFSLADFGLVDYPNKKEVSVKNEEIGAKWTMAPEMRRASSTADIAKADVYSLAKTLWIFLTNQNKGFDGQYSTDSIIHLKNFYPESYTSPIDNILISSTDNDPNKRPTVSEFLYALLEWKELSNDFIESNQQQWFEIQTKLFPTSIPKRVIWEDINDIVKVLKIVCSYESLNHFFFPDGGGLDLEDVRLSYEEGCIELDFQLLDIVKPKRLLFESFGYDHEWNYFRLEAENLEPWGVYEVEQNSDRENLTQVYPGHYEDYEYYENSHYIEDEDYERPEDMKHVTRWLKGSFVIFNKASVYNQTSSTYDGRHNKMTTEEFRDYIQRSVDHLREKEEEQSIFSKLFDNSNRRQKQRREQAKPERVKRYREDLE